MTYGKHRDPIPTISEPTVIFVIDTKWRPDDGDAIDIYNRTRKSWIIGDRARNQARYALGVRNGVVIGAYVIDEWYQTDPTSDRWLFSGHTARELAHVVGTSTARIKARQGNASPVRYFLDGIPAQPVASDE